MSQLNISLSPEFERELQHFMKARHIPTKAAAIRTAVKEGLAHLKQAKKSDFSDWAGLATRAATNPHPHFKNDDDLWK